MATVWLLPEGSDSAGGATDGDYLLRPRAGHDGEYEVGTLSAGCTWVGSLSRSLLPTLPQVDSAQEAPDQETVLAAVQGVHSAETHRGA